MKCFLKRETCHADTDTDTDADAMDFPRKTGSLLQQGSIPIQVADNGIVFNRMMDEIAAPMLHHQQDASLFLVLVVLVVTVIKK
jgi:hypothetical protein